MDRLTEELRRFADERAWQEFHTPKNLAMALIVEAAEIVEELQWLTGEESRAVDEKKKERLADEIGDVMIYLLQLADRLGIDPLDAARAKLEKNRAKYPVEKAKGNATKYTEL